MGNFYTNYTLVGVAPGAVAEAMAGRTAAVAPEKNGCVVAFDAATESQDLEEFDSLGKSLSERLQCSVLAVLNHDDDVLVYRLYQNGMLSDEYNSDPNYPAPSSKPAGGNAELLCQAFSVDNADTVRTILTAARQGPGGYLFAVHRHLALVEALNASVYAVGAGYSYVSSGDVANGLDEDTVLWVE